MASSTSKAYIASAQALATLACHLADLGVDGRLVQYPEAPELEVRVLGEHVESVITNRSRDGGFLCGPQFEVRIDGQPKAAAAALLAHLVGRPARRHLAVV